MALSKSKKACLLVLIILLAVLLGCPKKDKPAGEGVADTLMRGSTTSYWVIDRIEDTVAVLENLETLLTEERPLKDLPADVKEGQVLTTDSRPDATLQIDREDEATRTSQTLERFKRLKTNSPSQ
jgi:hypothetical protein